MEVFKSDPPVPNSIEAEGQRFFHQTVEPRSDEPMIEEDPLSSSESEGDGPSHSDLEKR